MIAIAVSTGGVIVTPVVPDTPSRVAIIVTLPTPVPVTTPGLPVLPTVAIASEEEIQLAMVVKSSVVPSEKVPVAVSCLLVPLASEGFTGVIAIESSAADVIVTVVVPDTAPIVAVIVALPTPLPVTRPWLPTALLTVAERWSGRHPSHKWREVLGRAVGEIPGSNELLTGALG